MKTLREQLDCLSASDRRLLILAFENGETAYVEINPGYYVGVNIKDKVRFTQDESSGVWSKGTING
jgi:hypothetical protein